MYRNFYYENIHKLRPQTKEQALGLCPFHNDRKPSFSCNLATGLWFCHGCGASGNAEQFASMLNISPPDVPSEKDTSREVARYTYLDADRNPVIQVRRYYPKTFRQYRYDAKQGWIAGLNGAKKFLYHFPEIVKQDVVYVCEGEKDVDTLWQWGIPATTNIGGALKWSDEYSNLLKDKSVVIIPDNDEVGRKHAESVAKSLYGKAKAIKIVFLPSGKDVSEWKALGGKKNDLSEIVSSTPLKTVSPYGI